MEIKCPALRVAVVFKVEERAHFPQNRCSNLNWISRKSEDLNHPAPLPQPKASRAKFQRAGMKDIHQTSQVFLPLSV